MIKKAVLPSLIFGVILFLLHMFVPIFKLDRSMSLIVIRVLVSTVFYFFLLLYLMKRREKFKHRK